MPTLGALATIALKAAASQPPGDIRPPCSHLYMIRFDSGSASLSPIGEAILDLFPVPDLRSGPTSKIVVFGHADTVGGDDADLALSRRRAEAVGAYLRRAGISPSNIVC